MGVVTSVRRPSRRGPIGVLVVALLLPIVVPVSAVEADEHVELAVTTTVDDAGLDDCPPVNPTATGGCSLRAAVTLANGAAGEHTAFTIVLPAGEYVLTSPLHVAPTGGQAPYELEITGAGDTFTTLRPAPPVLGSVMAAREVDLRLADLTLTGGTGTDLPPPDGPRDPQGNVGGGLWAVDARVLLDGVRVTDNQAVTGGGVATYRSELRLVGSTVDDNLGSLDGGGIAVRDGLVELTDSDVVDNVAYADGGGLHLVGAEATTDGGSVNGNLAEVGEGAGVRVVGPFSFLEPGTSTLTMTGTEVADNDAGAAGGGISAFEADVALEGGTTVLRNEAGGGGGIQASDATVVLRGSAVADNRTRGGGGGGIQVTASGADSEARLEVRGSQVSGNRATLDDGDPAPTGGPGGGIRSVGARVLLIDAEVLGNSAGGGQDGGGLSVVPNGAGVAPPLTITTSRVSNNYGVRGGGLAVLETATTIDRSVVGGNGGRGTGGIYAESATGPAPSSRQPLTITRSTVTGNSFDGQEFGDGAIVAVAVDLTLQRSTIVNNIADGVGAVAVLGGPNGRRGDADIAFTTVLGNSGQPAILIGPDDPTVPSAVTLTSNVVADNRSAELDVLRPPPPPPRLDLQCFGDPTVTGDFNVLGAVDCDLVGTGNLTGASDLEREPLGSYGGPTTTVPFTDDRVLGRVTSEAACGGGSATDQRGEPVPPTGCDAGAFQTSTSSVALDLDVPAEVLGGGFVPYRQLADLGRVPADLATNERIQAAPMSSIDVTAEGTAASLLGAVTLDELFTRADGGLDLAGTPLAAILLSDLPLREIGGWEAALAGTRLTGVPLQNITVAEALTVLAATDRPPLRVASIDLASTPMSSIPMSSIALATAPMSSIPLDGTDPGEDALSAWCAVDGVLDALGGQCRDATLMELTLAGVPMSSIPMSSIPMSSIPMGSIEIQGTPMSSIPMSSIPMSSIPMSSIPMGSIDLAGTPMSSIPMSSIDLAAAPMGSIPMSSIPMSSIPMSSIPMSSIILTDTPMGSIPMSSIPMSSIDLLAAPMSSIPMSSILVQGTPMSSIPMSSIDTDVLTRIVDCGSVDCQTGTLGDAAAAGAVREAATLGDLAAFFATSELTLEQVLRGVLGTIRFADAIDGVAITEAVLRAAIDALQRTLGGLDDYGDLTLFEALRDLLPELRFADVVDEQAITLAALIVGIDATGRTLGTLDDYADTTLFEMIGTILGQLRFSDVIDGEAITLTDLVAGIDAIEPPLTLGMLEDYGDMTLGDALLALLSPAAYPWEDLGLTVEQLATLPDTPIATADAVLTLDVAGLPAGSSATVELAVFGPTPALGTPRVDRGVVVDDVTVMGTITSTSLEFELSRLPTSGPVTITVPVRPTTLAERVLVPGAPGFPEVTGRDLTLSSTVTVTTPTGTVLDAATPGATLQVAGRFAGTATPVDVTGQLDGSELVAGHLLTPGDVHLFELTLFGGERVSLGLGGGGADLDLVLYGPVGDEFAGRSDLVAASTSEETIDIVDRGITAQPGSLDEVPLLDDRPVVTASARRGTASETIQTGPLPAGTYLVQVSGYDGATNPTRPYLLRTGVTGAPPLPGCAPWATYATLPAPTPATPVSALPDDVDTLYLVNHQRFAAAYGQDELDRVLDAIAAIDVADLGVSGAVVAVDGVAADAYADWTDDRCSVSAANAVVRAIGSYLDDAYAQRDIEHVVMVGGDDQVPMARVLDGARLSNQASYLSRFLAGGSPNNELVAAFAGGYLLTDDPYADRAPIATPTGPVFAATRSIGRLVESADDIVQALEHFVDFDGVLDPDTASSPLVTGYDFLDDGAEAVAAGLTRAGRVPAGEELALLVGADWDAQDLLVALGFLAEVPLLPIAVPSIASVNAHFDHQRLLPADQDRDGIETNLVTVADVPTGDDPSLAQRLLFSMGCHSGLSVSDVTIATSLGADWVQALTSEGALYAANTGYGYGDTELVDYSERLMAAFARNLDGSRSVGQALADAKQSYLAVLPTIAPYDAKVVAIATLYGLPMYRFDADAAAAPAVASSVTADAVPTFDDPRTGLRAALVEVGAEAELVTGDRGAWFEVDGRTRTSPNQPHQPLAVTDVTVADAVARGAVITAMRTAETLGGFDPVVQRPAVDLAANEPEPRLQDLAFPDRFQAIGHERGPVGLRQQLLLTTGRFVGSSESGVQQRFEDVQSLVYYADADTPASPAPRFQQVEVEADGTVEVAFAEGDDVRRVAVLHTQPAAPDWILLDLVPTSDGRWRGVLAGDDPGQIELYVQAVGATGEVAVRSAKGALLPAVQTDTPVDDDGDPIPVDPQPTLMFAGETGSIADTFLGPVTISAGPANAGIVLSVDGTPVDGGQVTLTEPGSYVLTATSGARSISRRITILELDLQLTSDTAPVPIGGTFEVVLGGLPAGVEAIVRWGDGATQTVAGLGVDRPVDLAHTYHAAGLYTVEAQVRGVVATLEFAVVFDPSGRFVTGGGQARSWDGEGAATFAVNARYQTTGGKQGGTRPQAQLRYRDGDLDVRADTFEWLVIADRLAYVEAPATVNGEPGHRLTLVLVDDQPNRLRARLVGPTGQVLHDHAPGAALTEIEAAPPLRNGQVRVHR